MLNKKELLSTLSYCANSIITLENARGVESLVQKSLKRTLGKNASTEIPLKEIGAKQAWGGSNGRLDVLYKSHGIEVKVIQFPRLGSVPSNSLYDIGQISSDFWRLKHAKDLRSGELIVLLRGDLVSVFPKPSEILREFHNRMFVDYKTSLKFGELSEKPRNKQRNRQIEAISEMGFKQPFLKPNGKKIVEQQGLALVSIPVIK